MTGIADIGSNEDVAGLIATKIMQETREAAQTLSQQTRVSHGNPDAAELTTKAIEDILYQELDNWRRWCRMRDYLPVKGRDSLDREAVASGGREIDELQAARMERIITALPDKLKAAFIAHQLNKIVVGVRVSIVYDVTRKCQFLGVARRRYYYLVAQAGRAVLVAWNGKI